ncbi:MAG TPA: hypothetical protein DDZ80_16020 [Cyanobacteria bacterium UBA8803]|nr:hypothetical protein [Cyanobacteria bacterium UBA9273]HBL59922.1 hypothetical protein [Cyanobacteria bacterium UBA8803]
MNPEFIDQWFPIEQQRNYISMLVGRVGLTRRRAECFVRLWTYLLLKQQQEFGARLRQPLTDLQVPEGFVACTHREAAELFYADKDRGSDRAAGMMIDKLLALGLIDKQFDGNTVCIQIRSLPNLSCSRPEAPVQLKVDTFNPRTDAVPVASFLARNYNWLNNSTTAVSHKIAKLLRYWANQYSTGMRVLRRTDNYHPVGFYLLYPTSTESEKNFFLPPSKSLHLSSASDIDPLEMASLGNLDCTSVFVRSWMIDTPYKDRHNVCYFLKDVQKTLQKMQADFPNLCDIYTMSIHPTYEELAMAVGFQKIGGDPKSSLYWVYTSLDQFVTLDIEQAISSLYFASPAAAV